MPLKVCVTQNSMALFLLDKLDRLGHPSLPPAPGTCQLAHRRPTIRGTRNPRRNEKELVMAFPRDQIPYSAIVDRPPLRLPKAARVVVWTIVNVEEWDIQGPMPRTVLPAPSGAQVIPDVPNFAWAEYGMRIGFWRLKSVLDKHKIKPTLA